MFILTPRRASLPSRPGSGTSRWLLTLLVALGLLATSWATGVTSNPAWGQTTDTSDSHPTLVPPDDTTTSSTASTLAPDEHGSSTTTTTGVPAVDPEAPPPVIDARLSPVLARVAVQAPDYDSAQAAYVKAWRRQVDAIHRRAEAEALLTDLGAAGQRLQSEINEATRRHDKSSARLPVLRQGVQNIAVANYVRSGTGGPADIGLDPNSATNARAAEVMVEAVTGTQQKDIQVHQAVVAATQAVIDVDRPGLAEVVARTAEQSTQLAQDVTDQAAAVADIARLGQAVADVRMTAMVTGTDMSLVALDAYWRAAATTAFFDPACKVAWSAIAGVGRVETLHGRYGGGPIDGNGEANPPIVGPPLDGSNNTAVLHDTDGGTIDTDSVWDRGVGPMAFIPSSWRAYGQDGNGDGIKDVENIYDAALATAGLLCRSGPLDNDANLRTAYFHYNQSQVYVDLVLGFTHGYDQFVIPPV